MLDEVINDELNEFDLSRTEIKKIKAVMEKQLKRQKTKLDRDKFIEIVSVKKHALENTIQFIKRNSHEIEEALTRELQLILRQQLKFKKATWGAIE